jgi:hypothetical protein
MFGEGEWTWVPALILEGKCIIPYLSTGTGRYYWMVPNVVLSRCEMTDCLIGLVV